MIKKQNAFTLIELLSALVIVAIVISVTILMFANFGQARSARMALQQWITSFKIAQQQAILESVVLGLQFQAHGYRYYQFKTQHKKPVWVPMPNNQLSAVKAFSDRIQLQLKVQRKISFSPHQPAILILPDGYITPFTLRLSLDHHCLKQLQVLSINNIRETACEK